MRPWVSWLSSLIAEKPSNTRTHDYRPETVAKDVSYAFQVFDAYCRMLHAVLPEERSLAGKRILEIGPGFSLGAAMLATCAGAHTTVLDAYPPKWQRTYHAPFVRALLVRAIRERPDLDVSPLFALLDVRSFDSGVLDLIPEPLESCNAGSRRFDLVLSNATLEHVRDVPQAIAKLAQLTAPGGVGIHCIDFRDHRDFAHPLEYLTVSIAEFERLFEQTFGECGNRWRASQFTEAFRKSGFDLLELRESEHATIEYLENVRSRLHPEQRGLADSDLSCLVGWIVCRRPPAVPDDCGPARPAGDGGAEFQSDASRRLGNRWQARLACVRLAHAFDQIGLRARLRHAAIAGVKGAYRSFRDAHARLPAGSSHPMS